MTRRRGFTLIELLVVISIITLLMGILLPALAKARATAQQVKDATQLQQIHKGFITFASQFKGKLPRPGLIDRLAVNGQEIPGAGLEDLTLNNTANLYSACIAQNYFSAVLCVGPSEPNALVIAKSDYNQEMYDPIGADQYWDPTFAADVTLPRGLSHTSYAHSTMTGKRGRQNWTDAVNSEFAIVSNRGVENGDFGNLYEISRTLEIHGGSKQWVGNVCWADNHTSLEQSFVRDGINYKVTGGGIEPDNFFKEDTGTGSPSSPDGTGFDIFLSIQLDVNDSAPNGQVTDFAWD